MTTPTKVTGTAYSFNTSGGAASCTTTYPAGSASGDYIIVAAHVSWKSASNFTISAAGGATWTQLTICDQAAANGFAIVWFGGFRGSETGVTINQSAAASSVNMIDVSCFAFQGATVDSTNPVQSGGLSNYANPSGATPITSQAQVTNIANSVLMLSTIFLSSVSNCSTSYSAGPTEVFDTVAQPSGSSYYMDHSAALLTVASPSTTSTYTATPSGTVYTSAIAALVLQPPSTGSGGGNITTFLTGSGNWTVPTGVTSVTVEAIGGGAGSWYGNQSGSNSAALYGGAGGGAYAKRVLAVTPGSSIPYQVGAAGLGGTASQTATNGGTSWFKSNDSNGCVAQGGQTSSGGNGGPGGATAGSYGDVVYRGGNGATSNSSNNSGGGGGGAGPGGQGGDASATSTAPGGGQTPGGQGGAGWPGGSNGSNAGSNYGGGAGGVCVGYFSTQNGSGGGVGWMKLSYVQPIMTPASDNTWSSTAGYKLTMIPGDTGTVAESLPGLTNAATEAMSMVETARILQTSIESINSVDAAGSGLLITDNDEVSSWEGSASVGITAVESSSTDDSYTNPLLNVALESISAAELSALVFGVADAFSESDSAYKQVGLNTPSADTATATETAQVGMAIQVTDSAAMVEAVSQLSVRGPEAISAADVAITQLVKYASDTAHTTELSDTELFFAVSDQISASGSAQVGYPKGASDVITAAESVKLTVIAPEPMAFTESVAVRLGKLIGERVYHVLPENRVYVVPDEL